MLDERLIGYLNDSKYDQIYNFIQRKISKNIILNDIRIIFCKLFDNFLLDFYGYMTVVANVSNTNYDRDNEFECYYYVIFDGKFRGREIDLYNLKFENNEPKNLKGISLDNAFYPFIPKEQYNEIAKRFISQYAPSYSKDNPIEVDEILENVGLKLKFRKLSETGEIFGKICFENINTEFEEDTIYVDMDAENIYGSGQSSMLFTVIHECIHWYIHKKFFLFRAIYNNSDAIVECKTERSEAAEIRNIENQADKIASMILMPENDFRKKYYEFCRQYLSKDDEAYTTRIIINALVEFYHVSKKAILIRLKNLEDNNLVGIYEFIDDRYVEPYLFNINKIDKSINISYSISNMEFLKLYCFNTVFRNYIHSGNYTWVDKHIVVNDKKYIESDKYGKERLTCYARNHMEICCMPFEYEYERNNRFYTESISFCRSNNKNDNKISSVNVPDEFFYAKNPTNENFWKDVSFIQDELRNMPANFGDALKRVMKNRHITIEKGSELSRLSPRTINRLRNQNENVSLNSILAIIIGLKLPRSIGDALIEKAGYNLANDREELVFYNLINDLKIFDIDKANELRRSMNKTPLSGRDE